VAGALKVKVCNLLVASSTRVSELPEDQSGTTGPWAGILFQGSQVGAGPVNLTFGKGQRLLQWQNNIGNIATNAFGFGNLAFGGSAEFNWEHLTPMYGGGLIDKYFGGTWGAHSILYRTDQYDNDLIAHELHHVWQSRALGDPYLAHYAGQGLLGGLLGKPFSFANANLEPNYYENLAYYFRWFRR